MEQALVAQAAQSCNQLGVGLAESGSDFRDAAVAVEGAQQVGIPSFDIQALGPFAGDRPAAGTQAAVAGQVANLQPATAVEAGDALA